MERLRIETFKEDGTHEYDLELPDAILHSKTSDLTSDTLVNIKCENYEITGNNMTFNLKTRQGRLGGGVKMVVYDMAKMNGSEKAKVEFQKPKEEPPKK
jgi:lipopolysaccharide export system protein LptC